MKYENEHQIDLSWVVFFTCPYCEKAKEIADAAKKSFTCPYCGRFYKGENPAHLLNCAEKSDGSKGTNVLLLCLSIFVRFFYMNVVEISFRHVFHIWISSDLKTSLDNKKVEACKSKLKPCSFGSDFECPLIVDLLGFWWFCLRHEWWFWFTNVYSTICSCSQ